MEERADQKEQWTRFWIYFEGTWMVRYDPKVWNINGCLNTDCYTFTDEEEMINRTNNPLERYNKRLNEKFSVSSCGSPSMTNFIIGIREESQYFVTKMQHHREGKVKKGSAKTTHKPVTIVSLPNDYETFLPRPVLPVADAPNSKSAAILPMSEPLLPSVSRKSAKKWKSTETAMTREEEIICSRCRTMGHWARNCPTK
jgi:hypothetical protein